MSCATALRPHRRRVDSQPDKHLSLIRSALLSCPEFLEEASSFLASSFLASCLLNTPVSLLTAFPLARMVARAAFHLAIAASVALVIHTLAASSLALRAFTKGCACTIAVGAGTAHSFSSPLSIWRPRWASFPISCRHGNSAADGSSGRLRSRPEVNELATISESA